MAQYFNVNGKVHELPDCINPSDYIRGAFTPITKVEADALRASPPPTAQEQSTAIANAIQKLLDDKAISMRYDSMMSARSYAGYTNPFQTEALRLATWAAACWLEAGAIEAGVIAGDPMPTVDEALARMPVY